MEPITRLEQLGVVVSMAREDELAFAEPKLEIIDRRAANEIITLTPREANAFALTILAKLAPYAATGWAGTSGD